MFLAQDVQDEMLDSPPFFTALRDVSRLFSPEYQDMVYQSTTAASTINFPHLPMLKQIPSSGTVEMAENGLVSRPLCSQLAASHSGWRSFKDVFHISFSADTLRIQHCYNILPITPNLPSTQSNFVGHLCHCLKPGKFIIPVLCFMLLIFIFGKA